MTTAFPAQPPMALADLVSQYPLFPHLELAAPPFYPMLWKLTLVKALTRSARRDAEWIRTEREDSHDR